MKRIILGIATIVAFGVCAYFYDAVLSDRGQAEIAEQVRGGTVTLSIGDRYANTEVSFVEDETVLDVLERTDGENGSMDLATETYTGVGVLVTAMYGMENGTDGNYWQYTVNSMVPPIGADTYVLTDGDRVEWRFIPSEF